MPHDNNYSLDPSSPDSLVEDQFFEEGTQQEQQKPEGPDISTITRNLKRPARWLVARRMGIGAGAMAGVGLLVLAAWKHEPATIEEAPPAPLAITAPVVPVAAPTPAPPVTEPTPEVEVAAPSNLALQLRCQEAAAQKRYKEVVDSCARAFASRPEAAGLAALVAEAEFDRGRMGPALDWAKKAIEADPNLADAYVYVGGAEQQAGHRQAAKQAYLKYLELEPTGRYANDLKTLVGSL